MFHHLRKPFKWLEEPYTMIAQVIKTDDGGENYVFVSQQNTIYANIQNKEDGEILSIGRDGSLVYRTIILLTKTRIGFGDPVFPDNLTFPGFGFSFINGNNFLYLNGNSITYQGNNMVDLTDPIIYYILAFGQVYRISLEGGVQDLDFDLNSTPTYNQQGSYVFYKYYAEIVRGPWQS